VSKYVIRSSRDDEGTSNLIDIRQILIGAGSIGLVLLTWFVPVVLQGGETQVPSVIRALFTGIVHCFITLCILESFLRGLLPLKRTYHLAFGVSVCVVLFRCLVGFPGNWFVIPYLIWGIFGAFIGGLIGTSIHDGIWEDNYPPPEEVRTRVIQHHAEVNVYSKRDSFGQRFMNIIVAIFGLILFAPIWLLIIMVLWLEDPGPIFFVKNVVGKGGINFHLLKFRTMVYGAEGITGPVLAQECDERTLLFGRFLRKTALDELPQLINILRGEMALVGPRPQRTVLVVDYLDEMPEFALRHCVSPGLAGLAQIAGSYYLAPRQKLRYDLLYIKHASLGFDLKLLFLAFMLVFWLRWKPGWDGRVPRDWFRWGKRN
jgi:lipopolysaccharide/colanic/teichoic acid biosynthesis glycosyltransferase